MRISCARSLRQDLCKRTTCAKCPCQVVEDPLPNYKSVTFPAFRVIDTHDLRTGLHFNFTSILLDGCTRSPQRVALGNWKCENHLHQHVAQSTRTIPTEGCPSKSDSATLPAFRALHVHDLHRGLPFQNHVSGVLHLTHDSKSYEMLHWSRKSILKLKNCNPSRPPNIASMVRIHCACHVKSNPSHDTRLPTFWQRPQNTAPATISNMCPIPCTCHVNSRFWPQHVTDSLQFMSKNVHEHPAKWRLRSKQRSPKSSNIYSHTSS